MQDLLLCMIKVHGFHDLSESHERINTTQWVTEISTSPCEFKLMRRILTSTVCGSPAAEMTHVTNHGRLLLQRLHQQREMDFLCDITIMVRDVEFRAHRNILAAFSKYFSSQAEKVQDVTTLDPDKVSRYALEKLLEFIYTGQMNLSR